MAVEGVVTPGLGTSPEPTSISLAFATGSRPSADFCLGAEIVLGVFFFFGGGHLRRKLESRYRSIAAPGVRRMLSMLQPHWQDGSSSAITRREPARLRR